MAKYRTLSREAQTEILDAFETKMREVAAIWGGDWTMRRRNPEMDIDRGWLLLVNKADGRQVDLTCRTYESPTKVEVSGEYKAGPDYLGLRDIKREKRPSITVSLDRPASAIAKDIQRRFLADYTALFLEVGRIVNEHQTAWDARAGAAERLCALAGGVRSGPHEWRSKGVDGRAWTNHDGGGVCLDLKLYSLSESHAARVIEFLHLLTTTWNDHDRNVVEDKKYIVVDGVEVEDICENCERNIYDCICTENGAVVNG